MLEVWSSEWHVQVEDSSQTGTQWMEIRSLGVLFLGGTAVVIMGPWLVPKRAVVVIQKE